MSYFLKPAVLKIRNITREWMTRVMLCCPINFSKISKTLWRNKDVFSVTAILVISIVILFLACRVSLKITNGERHEDIEMMIFLLIISMYCVIGTARSLLRARKSEKILKYELKKMMDLEHSICIGKLAKGIIHDLMNPLSAITLYIEEINRNPKNLDKSKEMMEKAVQATQRMNKFMESARHHIDSCLPICSKNSTANLNAEVKSVCDIVSYRAKISEIEIMIKPFENIILLAHPIRVYQILINILGNAIESNPDLIVISAEKSGACAKISISDDGCGIPVLQLKNLFTKPGTTKTNGTGMGLRSVHTIIENELRGTIDVSSAEGVGTTFTFQIPLAL